LQSALGSSDEDVFDLTRDQLDELPYGVITLARDGRIMRYNRVEAALARRPAEAAIGLNFFVDVAPCTNVAGFRGRFDAFAQPRDSAFERFDFSFAFRWGREDVSITFQRRHGREEINILVHGLAVESVGRIVGDRTPLSQAGRHSARSSLALPPPRVYPLDGTADLALRTRVHADDAHDVALVVEAAMRDRRPYAIEYRQLQADDSIAVVQEFGTFPAEPDTPGSALLVDVTARRHADYQNWYAAHHDALTGLANQRFLLQRIGEAVGEAATGGGLGAIVVVNIDRFREVNASFGSEIGDRLLRLFGLRLGEAVRSGDTVARLGGDWFAVLLTNLACRASVDDAVAALSRAVAAPFIIGERSYFLTMSVGVSVAPDDSASEMVLLRYAYAAARAAKVAGAGSIRAYSRDLSVDTAASARLYNELRCALERGEFELYYQPIYDVVHDRIVAVESLVRWNHPTRGCVLPGEFIATADATGLIVPLGEWVLREACRQGRAWWDAGFELRITINVSVVQFQQPNFVELVAEILAESAVPPGCIELEMTESVMVDGFRPMIRTLTRLKALGVRLAIDDFGTGYSSLAYLKYFPIDTLKIDRVFVTDITSDHFDRAIATVVLTLATELGLDCVVEGAESREQVDMLIAVGCTLLQGYYFARPTPADALPALLRASGARVGLDQPERSSTPSQWSPLQSAGT
jgi:photoactive yellow protein